MEKTQVHKLLDRKTLPVSSASGLEGRNGGLAGSEQAFDGGCSVWPVENNISNSGRRSTELQVSEMKQVNLI